MRRLVERISAAAGAVGTALAIVGWLRGETTVAYSGLGMLGIVIAVLYRPDHRAPDESVVDDPDTIYEQRMREQWSEPSPPP